MQWYLLILISVLFMSFANLIKKKILFKEHTIPYLTTICTFLFLFSLSFIHKVNFEISQHELLLIFTKAVLLFFAMIALMRTFKHNEISQVVPLKNLSIITIGIFGFLILGEIASTYAYLGIVLILIGTYLVELHPSLEHPIKPIKLFKNKYSSLIILYLILIGLVAILDKIIIASVDAYTFIFFTFLFLLILSWIMQIIFYKALRNFKNSLKNSLGLFFFAGLFTIISDFFYLKAIEIPSVLITLAVPLKRTSTLLTTIIGGKMFHEKHLLIRIIGTIIILLGVTLILI